MREPISDPVWDMGDGSHIPTGPFQAHLKDSCDVGTDTGPLLGIFDSVPTSLLSTGPIWTQAFWDPGLLGLSGHLTVNLPEFRFWIFLFKINT